MQRGAEFRIASDIPDYIRQARAEVPKAGFRLDRDGPAAWDDWLPTRYEVKALREGRTPHYLTFRRNYTNSPFM
jgi:tRNA (guanine-N7-)-methyltransferase